MSSMSPSSTSQQSLIASAFVLTLAVIAIVAAESAEPAVDEWGPAPVLESAVSEVREEPIPATSIATNEQCAGAVLRSLAAAQTQFRHSGVVDTDGDGAGEFGYLGELSGARALRRRDPVEGPPRKLDPPFLSATFRSFQEDALGHGVVTFQGYAFKVFLPASPKDGYVAGLGEGARGGHAEGDLPGSEVCEQHWCAYAWPIDRASGGKLFFINEEGDLLAKDCGDTLGFEHPPVFTAAFGEDVRGMGGISGWAAR